jgi:hypothetical protein
MDEAFLPFRQIIEEILTFRNEFVDEEAGVRSYITDYEIELPVELDISRDVDGTLRIGSTPPLYYVDTAIRPAFHHLRFTAQIAEDDDGE